jgi:transposase
MRPPQPLLAGAEAELTQLLDEVETKADYRRVLCVWLRAAHGLPAAEIARTLGWRISSVYNLHSRYQQEGAAALLSAGRGGRHHALLREEQERRLLASFIGTARQGGVVETGLIRHAYERQVGHSAAKSTVYRLLARHGWRKLAPRPAHPDASREMQMAFKKSSAVWYAPRPHAKRSVA